jgi:hypothetical protein
MTRRTGLWSRREVERHRKAKRKRPTSQKSKGKPKRKAKPKPKKTKRRPPGNWRNRKRPRGFRAREILRKVRNKRRKSDVLTAIRLAKKDDMDETTFVNFVQSLNFTGQEAYTFWFSPP